MRTSGMLNTVSELQNQSKTSSARAALVAVRTSVQGSERLPPGKQRSWWISPFPRSGRFARRCLAVEGSVAAMKTKFQRFNLVTRSSAPDAPFQPTTTLLSREHRFACCRTFLDLTRGPKCQEGSVPAYDHKSLKSHDMLAQIPANCRTRRTPFD